MKVNDEFKKKTGNSNSLKTNLIVCKDGHSREQKLPLSLYCLQNWYYIVTAPGEIGLFNLI